MDTRERRLKMLLICVSVVSVTILLNVLLAGSTRPSRRLTRQEAEREAYLHLGNYCNRNDLDISKFKAPKIVRGTLCHYEKKKDGTLYSVHGPTWDFYYACKGKPAITVFISYDEMRDVTELADVIRQDEE